jgi:hypothetical protein
MACAAAIGFAVNIAIIDCGIGGLTLALAVHAAVPGVISQDGPRAIFERHQKVAGYRVDQVGREKSSSS